MTGLPGMTDMRSLNKPGLSLITLVFSDDSNLYRERQMVSERLAELLDQLPSPLVSQVRWRDNKRAFDQAPEFKFLN